MQIHPLRSHSLRESIQRLIVRIDHLTPYSASREQEKNTTAARRAVAEWTASILEDEQVQTRLLGDARQGRLHHAVLGQLLLYAYGRHSTSSSPEATIPFSALADARASLRVKLDQMRDVLETEST